MTDDPERRVAPSVQVEDRDAVRVCAFHGRIDVFCASTLVSQVLAGIPDGTREIVIDLRDVDYIDSAGVNEVSRACRAARERGIDLTGAIAEPTPVHGTAMRVLRRVIDLT